MKVGVVGAGRVGLVSGLVLFELGHEVTLVDVDRARLERLRSGEMPFFEPDTAELLRVATGSRRWTVTDRADEVAGCEAVMITVPTPVGADGHYDLGAVREAVAALCRVRVSAGTGLRWRGVFLRSTVLPGTTQAIVGAALARSSADGSPPCPVGYLPEFLREGSALADARHPDRVVVGADDAGLCALARELFGELGGEFVDTGTRTAELVKLANNALLSVCISFANEIARLAETIDGADAMRVFAGVHLDRRFRGIPRAGIVDYLLPGPGFGGNCLAKDLAALAAYGEEQGHEPGLLDAAMRINETQPLRLVARIEAALGGLAGRRVVVLGLAFKPGTDDVRGSVALPIVRELAVRGADVRSHDPCAAGSTAGGVFEALGSSLLGDGEVAEAIDGADAVVLVTAWPSYLEALPKKLANRTRPVLFADPRGALRDVECAPCVTYLGVGLGAAPARGQGNPR